MTQWLFQKVIRQTDTYTNTSVLSSKDPMVYRLAIYSGYVRAGYSSDKTRRICTQTQLRDTQKALAETK